jgi:hypothetical protein
MPMGVASAQTGSAPVSESPLLPAQARFFDWGHRVPAHYNIPVAVEVDDSFDPSLFRRCAEFVVSRHDALRARFRPGPDGWRQVLADAADPLFEEIDLSGRGPGRWSEAIQHFHHVFDLSAGPLIGFLYLTGGPGQDILVLNVHHLVCDGIAIGVLLEELQDEYHARRSGREHGDLPPAASFVDHVEALRAWTHGPAADAGLTFWRSQRWPAIVLGKDRPNGSCEMRYLATTTVTLDPDRAHALSTALSAAGLTGEDAAVTALTAAVDALGWGRTVALDICRHGRAPLGTNHDPARTVGWLASVAPYLVTVARTGPGLNPVRDIAGQLRRFQYHELAWTALRYLGDPAVRAELAAVPHPELYLNYRGRDVTETIVQAPWRLAPIPLGVAQTREGRLPYQIKVWVDTLDDALLLTFGYSAQVYDAGTIEALAAATSDTLSQFATQPAAGIR